MHVNTRQRYAMPCHAIQTVHIDRALYTFLYWVLAAEAFRQQQQQREYNYD